MTTPSAVRAARLLTATVLSVTAFAMTAGVASADTYCVTPSTCDHPQATLQAALTAADAHAGPDTVQLAAATYIEAGLSYAGADPLEIDGAGRTASIITAGASPPASSSVLTLGGGAVTMRHVGIGEAGDSPIGINSSGELHLDDVAVTASASVTGSPEGVEAFSPSTISHSSVALPGNGSCVFVGDTSTIDHLATSGCSAAVNVQGATAAISSSELDGAGYGVLGLSGATVTVDDTVIRPVTGSTGLAVTAFGAFQTSLMARHVTIVQSVGTALSASNNGATSTASVTVSDSIMRGSQHSAARSATGAGASNITVTRSDVDPSTDTSSGPGALTVTDTVNVDPAFVSDTDLHLTSTSPLLDLDPAPLAGDEPTTDFDGTPRIIHGARDYGAYEYARPPAITSPVAVSAIGPTSATVSGSIAPGEVTAQAALDYGPTIPYATRLTLAPVPVGALPQAQQVQLTGLTPSTTYHVRLVAIAPAGATNGPDVTFTTAAAPVAPPPLAPLLKKVSPTLAKLKISPTHRVTKHALTLSFTVSAPAGATFPATLKVAITHAVHGHRAGKACSTTAHKGKACTVTRTPWSKSTTIRKAGAGKLTLPAKPSGHALKPGSYSVRVTFAGRTTTLKLTITGH